MNRIINILIVEDEAILAMTLRMVLEKENSFKVCNILSSGEDTVDYVNNNFQPDIMIFDNRLAGNMEGIEAARLIHLKYDIPVIFTTGYEYHDFIKRASIIKPVSCFSKPVNYQELINTIKNYFMNMSIS